MEDETEIYKQLLKMSEDITLKEWDILSTKFLELTDAECSYLHAEGPNPTDAKVVGLIKWYRKNPTVSVDSLKHMIAQAKQGNFIKTVL